jgi:hypothetical protein
MPECSNPSPRSMKQTLESTGYFLHMNPRSLTEKYKVISHLKFKNTKEHINSDLLLGKSSAVLLSPSMSNSIR